MSLVDIFKALASERRLLILHWLKDPRAHFPPQKYGDLVEEGVCGVLIAEKLDLTPPTLSEHMRILIQADLVKAKRVKQWMFYSRNEEAIRQVKALIDGGV